MIRPARALTGAMQRLAILLALIGCGSSGGRPQDAGGGAVAVPAPAVSIDWAKHGLADAGCFVLRDLATGAETVSDEARCALGQRPHSTFKIPNALIGVDLGILDGPDAVMRWNREAHPAKDRWPKEWLQDLPLRRAIEISAVPLFQNLALQIGAPRMQEYLDRLEYGNRTMGDGLDHFWLDGPIRISARQQVDFVARLVRGELPVSARAQEVLREVLRREARGGATIFHKTGTGAAEGDRWLGWQVGWIERDGRAQVFALWVEDASFDAVRATRERTFEALLADLGVPAPGQTLVLEVKAKGPVLEVGLHNVGREPVRVYTHVATHEWQSDWLEIQYQDGDTYHHVSRPIRFVDDRDKSAPVVRTLAPGETDWQTVDVGAWARRKVNGGQPLPAKGSLSATAIYDTSKETGVWSGRLETQFAWDL